MNKKSLFLLLTVGFMSLCQVQFLKAPEGFFARIFGGAKPEGPRNGGRSDDPTFHPREPRAEDPVARPTGGRTTTGTARVVTPRAAAGAGGARVSGGSGRTSVAGQEGPGLLDAAEVAALRRVADQDVNFSMANKSGPAQDRLMQEKQRTADLALRAFKEALLKDSNQGGLSKKFFENLQGFKESNPKEYQEINTIMDSVYESAEKGTLKLPDIQSPLNEIRNIVTEIERAKAAQLKSSIAGKYAGGKR